MCSFHAILTRFVSHSRRMRPQHPKQKQKPTEGSDDATPLNKHKHGQWSSCAVCYSSSFFFVFIPSIRHKHTNTQINRKIPFPHQTQFNKHTSNASPIHKYTQWMMMHPIMLAAMPTSIQNESVLYSQWESINNNNSARQVRHLRLTQPGEIYYKITSYLDNTNLK